MKCFILMADVIGSGRHDPNKLMSQLKQVVNSINIMFKEELVSPLTITLGDEFQGILSGLKESTEMIIKLEEEIIGSMSSFKLRYVLYEGNVDTDINATVAYEMLGSGLTDARKEIEKLKKKSLRFSFILENHAISKKLNSYFELFQFFVDRWSQRDYGTVDSFLRGFTYKEVAKNVKKDDSTLWRKRKSLAIDQFCTCKNLISNDLIELSK